MVVLGDTSLPLVKTVNMFEKSHSWGELSNTFMNRPGVTINGLIKRDANYVEKNKKKLPLGAGFRSNSRATMAIQ